MAASEGRLVDGLMKKSVGDFNLAVSPSGKIINTTDGLGPPKKAGTGLKKRSTTASKARRKKSVSGKKTAKVPTVPGGASNNIPPETTKTPAHIKSSSSSELGDFHDRANANNAAKEKDTAPATPTPGGGKTPKKSKSSKKQQQRTSTAKSKGGLISTVPLKKPSRKTFKKGKSPTPRLSTAMSGSRANQDRSGETSGARTPGLKEGMSLRSVNKLQMAEVIAGGASNIINNNNNNITKPENSTTDDHTGSDESIIMPKSKSRATVKSMSLSQKRQKRTPKTKSKRVSESSSSHQPVKKTPGAKSKARIKPENAKIISKFPTTIFNPSRNQGKVKEEKKPEPPFYTSITPEFFSKLKVIANEANASNEKTKQQNLAKLETLTKIKEGELKLKQQLNKASKKGKRRAASSMTFEEAKEALSISNVPPSLLAGGRKSDGAAVGSAPGTSNNEAQKKEDPNKASAFDMAGGAGCGRYSLKVKKHLEEEKSGSPGSNSNANNTRTMSSNMLGGCMK